MLQWLFVPFCGPYSKSWTIDIVQTVTISALFPNEIRGWRTCHDRIHWFQLSNVRRQYAAQFRANLLCPRTQLHVHMFFLLWDYCHSIIVNRTLSCYWPTYYPTGIFYNCIRSLHDYVTRTNEVEVTESEVLCYRSFLKLLKKILPFAYPEKHLRHSSYFIDSRLSLDVKRPKV